MKISINNIEDRIINKKGKIPPSQVGYALGAVNKPFNKTDGAVTPHNTAGGSDAQALVNSIINGGITRWEAGLANTYIDNGHIVEVLDQKYMPYAIGNKAMNTNNFSVEICDGLSGIEFTRAEELACCYIAYKCKKNGVKYSDLNTRVHGQYHEIDPSCNATACPLKSRQKHGDVTTGSHQTYTKAQKHFEDRVKFYENGGVYDDAPKGKPKWHVHTFKNHHGAHYFPLEIDGKDRFTWKEIGDDLHYQYSYLNVNNNNMYEVTCLVDTDCYSDKACTKKDGKMLKGKKYLSQHVGTIERG